MAALSGDGSGAAEGLRALVCGVVFGATSPLAGAPIDAVKTRMQADPLYARSSAVGTLRGVVAAEGAGALYRGLLPPLLSSSAFRSIQFSAYAATVGACRDSEALCAPAPALGGTPPRVLLGGLAASTARSVIEVPCEYVKIARQLGRPWRGEGLASRAYVGFGLSWGRMVVALGGYFWLMDLTARHGPGGLWATPGLGPFLQGSLSATAAWAAAWPLELLRTTAQAGLYPGLRAGARARALLRDRGGGLAGLYRGIGPGLARSVVANGCATLAYTTCQACWPAGSGGG